MILYMQVTIDQVEADANTGAIIMAVEQAIKVAFPFNDVTVEVD